MPSLTVENYVKQIYQICAANGGKPATTGQLASHLGVSPGSVTSMLKMLRESNLVTYTPYEGVNLTPPGAALALRIVRRHRLIEVFLAQTLGLDWGEVHDEAEHMEHAVSDLLVDRIDEYLGYPEVDPHGDPIPRADGTLLQPETQSLLACQPGQQFRLARVTDQSTEFLNYLSDAGLAIGAEGRLLDNRHQAGTVSIAIDDREATLGHAAAAKILVALL
ncbi:MAG: metal-dependent transcriptional regulator [Planctomycetota bacterium]|nr:MAG: metal-dependent transcriptional regulator [Planctomycetota bacterium]REJ98573.1 MAG: metal-dependent transcriptional regulator [Planctomycetota bacterium]REK29873.1 MAG: metal-dependent transcriptional regulator [Planctomycetota bacterium]REK47957.1 MAG: metal-dependent transcriptional regulator [Planctomycetota bacterium]